MKTIQRRSQTELKINENILELISPNAEEPAIIQPIVENSRQKPLTIPKSSEFSFFGFRKRTKNEIAMDRIRNIEKFVLDKSAEIKEEFEELEDEFEQTSDVVKNLASRLCDFGHFSKNFRSQINSGRAGQNGRRARRRANVG